VLRATKGGALHGAWVGFKDENDHTIKKISLEGGSAITLTPPVRQALSVVEHSSVVRIWRRFRSESARRDCRIRRRYRACCPSTRLAASKKS